VAYTVQCVAWRTQFSVWRGVHSSVCGVAYTVQCVAWRTQFSVWRGVHSSVCGVAYTVQCVAWRKQSANTRVVVVPSYRQRRGMITSLLAVDS